MLFEYKLLTLHGFNREGDAALINNEAAKGWRFVAVYTENGLNIVVMERELDI